MYSIVQEFFDSLKANYPDIPTYVIDDCSPLPHDFKVDHRNEKNLGYTKSVNIGLEYVFTRAEAKLALVLNDDLVLRAGDLDRFLDLTGKVIASPMDTAASHNDRFGAIWGITKEAYKLLGPMDEQYVNFFSDVEYYNRAKKHNIEIIKWYDIVVEHRESSTFNRTEKQALLEKDAEVYNKAHG